MTVSKYMNEIKLEECGFNGRHYEFSDSQNHLSERSQEMIFSTAILLYNQLVAELTRPAFQKLDRTAIATHVAQTPFPLWITSLEVEKGDISEPLLKRMIKPTKALFNSVSEQDVFHRLIYDIYEQLKREISTRIELARTSTLYECEVAWKITNLAIHRIVRVV
ncbi:hypothetical protein VroAM7_49010 (plasmid) [Vibrio rotiferianus]|uniref:Uncharacterized protein n=1 Tax=Vibrio rotiferianus TaxID=190895 RepID=A0A510IGG9_9VIBR|nr:hypothetical protein [Vibrio rotiferianus]BBL92248.1 hypothetical protein VroAM7_49010 [Vibrio rotiferianus]